MAPDDALTIEDVVASIGKRPWGSVLLVVGDFNNDLAALDVRERDEGIAAALAEEGLEDMSDNFLPWHKPWLKYGRIWAMLRGGRKVRSWTDYILCIDSCLFQNVAFRDVQHNTEHYLVLGFLRGADPAAH